MPKYRLTGQYNFAPDRGSPNGNQKPFVHEFEADNDQAASRHVEIWREDKVDISDDELKRIDLIEETTTIDLA